MEIIKANPNVNEEERLDFYEQMFNALADKISLKSYGQFVKVAQRLYAFVI